jgi:hypothetical protein
MFIILEEAGFSCEPGNVNLLGYVEDEERANRVKKGLEDNYQKYLNMSEEKKEEMFDKEEEIYNRKDISEEEKDVEIERIHKEYGYSSIYSYDYYRVKIEEIKAL